VEKSSRRVADDVAEAVQTLERRPGADAGTVLTALIASSLSFMPGADHAGITVVTRDGTAQTLSATDRYPSVLDEIQRRHPQGPCLAAAWEHHLVRIDDVNAEQRWPGYCRAVAKQTSIRSIASFPLFAEGRTTGALNFHAEHPHAFDDDAVELGLVLASNTALVWHMVRRDEQFHSALASRDVIGQAKGMLMERFTIEAGRAFELLKRLSQESNIPVAVIARRLIAGERSRRAG
jgi:GAF domain-containing protein